MGNPESKVPKSKYKKLDEERKKEAAISDQKGSETFNDLTVRNEGTSVDLPQKDLDAEQKVHFSKLSGLPGEDVFLKKTNDDTQHLLSNMAETDYTDRDSVNDDDDNSTLSSFYETEVNQPGQVCEPVELHSLNSEKNTKEVQINTTKITAISRARDKMGTSKAASVSETHSVSSVESFETKSSVTETDHEKEVAFVNSGIPASRHNKPLDIHVSRSAKQERDDNSRRPKSISPASSLDSINSKIVFSYTSKADKTLQKPRDQMFDSEINSYRTESPQTQVENVVISAFGHQREITTNGNGVFRRRVTWETNDNRIKLLKDKKGERDGILGEKRVQVTYSNVIFLPDKSKGAFPKRYGPSRLGSRSPDIRVGENEDSGSQSENECSLTHNSSLNHERFHPQNNNERFLSREKETRPLVPDHPHGVLSTDRICSNAGVLKDNLEFVDDHFGLYTGCVASGLSTGFKQQSSERSVCEGGHGCGTPIVLCSQTDPDVVSCIADTVQNATNCKPRGEDVKMENFPIGEQFNAQEDSDSHSNTESVSKPERVSSPTVSAPFGGSHGMDNICQKEFNSVEEDLLGRKKTSRSTTVHNPLNCENLLVDNCAHIHKPSFNQKTNSSEYLQSEREEICEQVCEQGNVHAVSFPTFMKSCTFDIDWCVLKSKQGQFARLLKSCYTNIAEDNRMCFEFSLPFYCGKKEILRNEFEKSYPNFFTKTRDNTLSSSIGSHREIIINDLDQSSDDSESSSEVILPIQGAKYNTSTDETVDGEKSATDPINIERLSREINDHTCSKIYNTDSIEDKGFLSSDKKVSISIELNDNDLSGSSSSTENNTDALNIFEVPNEGNVDDRQMLCNTMNILGNKWDVQLKEQKDCVEQDFKADTAFLGSTPVLQRKVFCNDMSESSESDTSSIIEDHVGMENCGTVKDLNNEETDDCDIENDFFVDASDVKTKTNIHSSQTNGMHSVTKIVSVFAKSSDAEGPDSGVNDMVPALPDAKQNEQEVRDYESASEDSHDHDNLESKQSPDMLGKSFMRMEGAAQMGCISDTIQVNGDAQRNDVIVNLQPTELENVEENECNEINEMNEDSGHAKENNQTTEKQDSNMFVAEGGKVSVTGINEHTDNTSICMERESNAMELPESCADDYETVLKRKKTKKSDDNRLVMIPDEETEPIKQTSCSENIDAAATKMSGGHSNDSEYKSSSHQKMSVNVDVDLNKMGLNISGIPGIQQFSLPFLDFNLPPEEFQKQLKEHQEKVNKMLLGSVGEMMASSGRLFLHHPKEVGPNPSKGTSTDKNTSSGEKRLKEKIGDLPGHERRMNSENDVRKEDMDGNKIPDNGSDSSRSSSPIESETEEIVEPLAELDAANWDAVVKLETIKCRQTTESPSKLRCTVLCIDISESMIGDPWQQMKEVLEIFVKGIESIKKLHGTTELVSMVTFGHETKVALTPTTDYSEVMRTFDKLEAKGNTPLEPVLFLAVFPVLVSSNDRYRFSMYGRSVRHRVILLTDARPTPHNLLSDTDKVTEGQAAEAAETLVRKMKWFNSRNLKNIMNIHCIPIGADPNMELIDIIAKKSGGDVVASTDIAKLCTHTHNYLNSLQITRHIIDAGIKELDKKLIRSLITTLYPDITEDDVSQMISEIEFDFNLDKGRNKKSGKKATFSGIATEENNNSDNSDSDESTDSNGLESDSLSEVEGMPPLGTRVKRGPDFNADEIVVVSETGTITGHSVRNKKCLFVLWDCGVKTYCRYGERDSYDVIPDDVCHMACKIEDKIKVGYRVRRGPDWQYGNQDGGSDQLGTVINVCDGEVEVTVRWDNGNFGRYRYNYDGAYDVLISTPEDPFGVQRHTHEMNRRNFAKIRGIDINSAVHYRHEKLDIDLTESLFGLKPADQSQGQTQGRINKNAFMPQVVDSTDFASFGAIPKK